MSFFTKFRMCCRNILVLPFDLQTEQETSSLAPFTDNVYHDASLEDISYPAHFNLKDVRGN